MTLEGLRADIDRIDARILALLEERLEKALLARRCKTRTRDPAREEEVLAALTARSAGLAEGKFVTELYRRIIAECASIQDRDLRLVGFQGPRGAWAEAAARALVPGSASLAFGDYSAMLEALLSGKLDYCAVPVPPLPDGMVEAPSSFFGAPELRVAASIDQPLDLCLLALPGLTPRDGPGRRDDPGRRNPRTIYLWPGASQGCRRFFARGGLEAVELRETEDPARALAQERPEGGAAVANAFAAERYGLSIIESGIQDSPEGSLRFLAIEKSPLRQAGQAEAGNHSPGNNTSNRH